MSGSVLEIKDLSRCISASLSVDVLPLSVNAGEVYDLLGLYGAGKITRIKMLTALLTRSPGDARAAGFARASLAVGVRRASGYVRRAVSVDNSLAGYEYLPVFAKLYDLQRLDLQEHRLEIAEERSKL